MTLINVLIVPTWWKNVIDQKLIWFNVFSNILSVLQSSKVKLKEYYRPCSVWIMPLKYVFQYP